MELVSRALTDSHFSKFLLKIPSVFTHYNAKNLKRSAEIQTRVNQRIQELYWQSYSEFVLTFGLKLNYSLKYERGINLVHLVKRVDRKTFKDGNIEEF